MPDEALVYVDQFPEKGWGKWNGGGHMLSNNIFILHHMARRIGLRRSWFQREGRFPHYDLTRSKRLLALQHGAVSIGFGHIPADVLVRRPDGTLRRYGEIRS